MLKFATIVPKAAPSAPDNAATDPPPGAGESLETPIGPYAEAAHIKPLGRPHSGPDRLENLLCLCPNDHVLFDKGSVHILDDLTVVKSGGLTSKLHTVHDHNIDSTFLRYHRENFGFG